MSATRDRLAATASALRRHGRAAPERLALVLGGLLLPVGLAAVVVGWYGAAHTPRAIEQIPYLISGGLLGVALVAVGGFLLCGYWVARAVRENRLQSDRVIEALDRLEGRLAAPGLAAGLSAPAAHNSALELEPGLVATRSGSLLHRPDCQVVASRDRLRHISAGTPGFSPCRICDPPLRPEDAPR